MISSYHDGIIEQFQQLVASAQINKSPLLNAILRPSNGTMQKPPGPAIPTATKRVPKRLKGGRAQYISATPDFGESGTDAGQSPGPSA